MRPTIACAANLAGQFRARANFNYQRYQINFQSMNMNPANEGLGKQTPVEINVTDLKQMMDSGQDIVLLDCREPNEYEFCHVAGFQLVPAGQIPEWAGSQDSNKETRIAVMCHHGVRSLRTTSWLRENGFHKAQSVAGGIEQWSTEIDDQVPRY